VSLFLFLSSLSKICNVDERNFRLDKTTNPSSSKNRNPKTFPTNVNWDELRDHCVGEHFTACQDVARLSRADLNELRRRLYK
jgi:hypothetical protein